jgi:hypothetical protein
VVSDHSLPSSESSASSLSCWRMLSHIRSSSRRRFLSFVAPLAELMYLTTSEDSDDACSCAEGIHFRNDARQLRSGVAMGSESIRCIDGKGLRRQLPAAEVMRRQHRSDSESRAAATPLRRREKRSAATPNAAGSRSNTESSTLSIEDRRK